MIAAKLFSFYMKVQICIFLHDLFSVAYLGLGAKRFVLKLDVQSEQLIVV